MENIVYFRAFEPEDAVLIHEWKNSDELNKLTVGLNKKTCFEEDKKWVEDHMAHNPYYAYWAICSKETGKIIGWFYLNHIHYINKSAEYGGLMIGDKDYQDGLAWIETYQYVLEYTFERLGLNRLYGTYIQGHPSTSAMAEAMFFKTEGIHRQSIYKNGQLHDEVFASLLASEYFEHKNNGEYATDSILKRLTKIIKSRKA